MQLYSPLVNTEIGSDLLVESSLHDMRKHFEFPLAKGVEARQQFIPPDARIALLRIPGKGASYCADQLVFRRALFQEVLRASTHGLHGRGNVAMPRQEENRHGIASLCEHRL